MGPDVDGVHDKCARPRIELVWSREEVERADRDAFNSQAATTAVSRQRLPDAVAGEQRKRRGQIVTPEEVRLLSVELVRDVVIDRRAHPNRATHLPRVCRRRCSRSSTGTRLMVSPERLESGTTRNRSARRSTSSMLGDAGRRLPSRSLASCVVGFAMSTKVVDVTDIGCRPRHHDDRHALRAASGQPTLSPGTADRPTSFSCAGATTASCTAPDGRGSSTPTTDGSAGSHRRVRR